MIRQGKGRSVIFTNHGPALRKSKIEFHSMLAKPGVHRYGDDNTELDSACRKYNKVCILAVIDAGDSDMLRSMTEKNSEK
jgi:large subunit ribosomal protein L30e